MFWFRGSLQVVVQMATAVVIGRLDWDERRGSKMAFHVALSRRPQL